MSYIEDQARRPGPRRVCGLDVGPNRICTLAAQHDGPCVPRVIYWVTLQTVEGGFAELLAEKLRFVENIRDSQ